jgi:hypothetical protein
MSFWRWRFGPAQSVGSILDASGSRRHYAPITYHQYYIAQMYVLEAMTGVKLFGEYTRRWCRHLMNAVDSPMPVPVD